MTEPLKVYEFSYKRICFARTEAQAREQFAESLEDTLQQDILDVDNWISEVLGRNDHTEWMYRMFENDETMKEVSDDR